MRTSNILRVSCDILPLGIRKKALALGVEYLLSISKALDLILSTKTQTKHKPSVLLYGNKFGTEAQISHPLLLPPDQLTHGISVPL